MKQNNFGGKKDRPVRPKSFPNYLLTKHDEETTKPRAPQSSAFVADELLDAAPSVPFLDQNKTGLRRHEETKKEVKMDKDYFLLEQKKFNKEKRVFREQQRWQLNGSMYQSRRPFKPTEFPSLWHTRTQKPGDKKVDYQQIKSALVIPADDLILIDTNPLPEQPIVKEENAKKQTPKRALHRSLRGIMEQEKVQKSWDMNRTRPQKSHSTGFQSYFD